MTQHYAIFNIINYVMFEITKTETTTSNEYHIVGPTGVN